MEAKACPITSRPTAVFAREARQRSLAQHHDAQVHNLDRQAAPVSVARAVCRHEGGTNPLGLVSFDRDRYLVALSREATVSITEQRRAGDLASALRDDRCEGLGQRPRLEAVHGTV